MQLPESQRMALVLRRYEQLSYEEIAEVLDLSVPAVKSVLFRARTELRARLSKYLG
jgi:RNA polymerase sigma factor (sigma-70 family)